MTAPSRVWLGYGTFRGAAAMIDVSALMPVLYLGMSVGSMLWDPRARRRRVWWINVATAHFGPASPVGEGARRWSGTRDGSTWTLVARLSNPDLATRVFAAASLGAQLPDAHRTAAVADAWSSLEAPEPPRHAVDLLNRFTSRGDGPTRRLLALLAAPQPGAAEEVVRALSSLGTTDAIMPLLDLRRVSITDRRLVPAVDAALKSIRGTLQGVDGGRLAVVEGDPTRGGLSVADEAADE